MIKFIKNWLKRRKKEKDRKLYLTNKLSQYANYIVGDF